MIRLISVFKSPTFEHKREKIIKAKLITKNSNDTRYNKCSKSRVKVAVRRYANRGRKKVREREREKRR